MKNRLYNRILVCGLLSSSFVLFASQPNLTLSTSSSQLTTSTTTTSTTTPKHHHTHNLLDTLGETFHIGGSSGHTSPGQLSPRDGSLTPSATPKIKRPKSSSHSSTSSASTPMPDPSNPATLQQHHHHFGRDLKKIEHGAEELGHEVIIIAKKVEHLVAKYGTIVCQDIQNNPEIITDILTAFGIDQAEAKSVTTIIESGVSRTQTILTAIDDLVQQAKAAQAAQQPTMLQTIEGDVETMVLSPLTTCLNYITNYPTLAIDALTPFLGTAAATTTVTELLTVAAQMAAIQKSLQPASTTTAQSSTQPTVTTGSGSGSYKLIGGAAMTLIAFLVMLHKTNYLPTNLSTLLNNIISSALNQHLVQTVTQAL